MLVLMEKRRRGASRGGHLHCTCLRWMLGDLQPRSPAGAEGSPAEGKAKAKLVFAPSLPSNGRNAGTFFTLLAK